MQNKYGDWKRYRQFNKFKNYTIEKSKITENIRNEKNNNEKNAEIIKNRKNRWITRVKKINFVTIKSRFFGRPNSIKEEV